MPKKDVSEMVGEVDALSEVSTGLGVELVDLQMPFSVQVFEYACLHTPISCILCRRLLVFTGSTEGSDIH